MQKKNTKYYIGFGCFLSGCSPIVLVPLLPFIVSAKALAWILPVLFVVSKIFLLISTYILGKPVVMALKAKLKDRLLMRSEKSIDTDWASRWLWY